MSTFKSRPWSSAKKGQSAHSRSGMTCCLNWRSLVTLRSSSWMKGEWSGRLTDGLGLCFGEERAKHKSKAFGLSVNLPPHPQLWSWALDSDRKNEIADRSDKITLLWRVDSLCLCLWVRCFRHVLQGGGPRAEQGSVERLHLSVGLEIIQFSPRWAGRGGQEKGGLSFFL